MVVQHDCSHAVQHCKKQKSQAVSNLEICTWVEQVQVDAEVKVGDGCQPLHLDGGPVICHGGINLLVKQTQVAAGSRAAGGGASILSP